MTTEAKKIRNHLQAILDAASDLVVAVGVPDTAEELVNGERVRQIAFCECVRRTGEAVAQIDSLEDGWLAAQFPKVPWRDVKATRNLLTHHYWTVDYTILHTIATVHLPQLTAPVAVYLGEVDPYDSCDAPGRAAPALPGEPPAPSPISR